MTSLKKTRRHTQKQPPSFEILTNEKAFSNEKCLEKIIVIGILENETYQIRPSDCAFYFHKYS